MKLLKYIWYFIAFEHWAEFFDSINSHIIFFFLHESLTEIHLLSTRVTGTFSKTKQPIRQCEMTAEHTKINTVHAYGAGCKGIREEWMHVERIYASFVTGLLEFFSC